MGWKRKKENQKKLNFPTPPQTDDFLSGIQSHYTNINSTLNLRALRRLSLTELGTRKKRQFHALNRNNQTTFYQIESKRVINSKSEKRRNILKKWEEIIELLLGKTLIKNGGLPSSPKETPKLEFETGCLIPDDLVR